MPITTSLGGVQDAVQHTTSIVEVIGADVGAHAMNKVNLLLGRGSPRSNIINVELWNEKLPCDKIIPRFTAEWGAYAQMRKYFLNHTEYTHLVLATDDIVVHPRHIDILQDDLEITDYPVLTGMMNVEQNDMINRNISMSLPIKDRKHRHYDWLTINQIESFERFFKVAFSGFPLMAIRRDIVNEIMFDADRVFEGKPPNRGASLDTVFCWYCQERDIPITVDKKIDMKHLRKSGRLRLDKTPRLYFWAENGEEKEITL